MTLAGSIGALTNSMGRILWCLAFDYLSFRTIMTILNISLLLCCIGCYFITNGTFYTIIVILTYLSLGALYGLMPTQVVRIMGVTYGPIIYPFVFIGFTISAIIQFTFH